MPGRTPPPFDHIVDAYGLTLLEGGLDLSLENGDLAVTKDGDLKLGDTVGNALFRLVQAWRLNLPHLRFLFDLVAKMQARRQELDGRLDALGHLQRASFDIRKFPMPDPEFVTSFHQINDEQGAAEYGTATYAGCVCLLLSGVLLRFRDDIEATNDDWQEAGPLFNGCSVGQIIVAAANGFRHEDEWAKARSVTRPQQVSQSILAKALASEPGSGRRWAGGRCPEILDVLSQGGNFDQLAAAFFGFAHNIGLRRRAAADI